MLQTSLLKKQRKVHVATAGSMCKPIYYVKLLTSKYGILLFILHNSFLNYRSII